MASLLGSPLGLTTLTSNSNQDGFSTFYGGDNNNFNVNQYNNGTPLSIDLGDAQGIATNRSISLFTGKRANRFFPNIGKIGTDSDTTGLDQIYNGIDRNILHNDDVYDTSILNIIEKLSPCPRAALKAQDFAYLKNLGVLPNNRLMIARRFHNPVKDNIMDTKGESPKSVLISWNPEGTDFLSFDFGEVYEEADADFTEVINGLGKGLGEKISSGFDAIPLPGFTEIWQRKLFEELGILEKGSSSDLLPSGNPNIIKQAKQRKTIGSGKAGSGLKCTITIKMEVEYEQKFISGIDPTIAWMDILSNTLSFGTSNSSTYGLSSTFTKKLDRWTSDPKFLLLDIMESLQSSFKSIKESLDSLVKGIIPAINDALEGGLAAAIKTKASKALDQLGNVLIDTLKSVVKKYKIEIIGIANALSGSPSTPWHITIGNPLRPIFSSGDMLTESVTVKLGSTLAFNDLPSSIKVDFSLRNARPLGMQEILAKFNNGHLRVTQVKQDFVEKTELKEIEEFSGTSRPSEDDIFGPVNRPNQNVGQIQPSQFTTASSSLSAISIPSVGSLQSAAQLNLNKTTKESDI